MNCFGKSTHWVLTLVLLCLGSLARGSALQCALLFPESSRSVYSNQEVADYLHRFRDAAVVIHLSRRFNFGTDSIAGKVVILENSPLLLGVEERHGDKTVVHQVDFSFLEGSERTVFVNRPEIFQSFTKDVELKATTPLKLMASPQAVPSINAERMPELISQLENRKTLFAADVIADFFKGQPEVVRKLIRRWYQDLAPTVLKVADGFKEQHRTLLLDPGIASRSQQFSSFYREFISKNQNASVLQIRNAFSQTLGVWKGWRGVMLSQRVGDKNNPVLAERLRFPGVFRNYDVRGWDAKKSIYTYFDEGLVSAGGMGGPTGIFDAILTHSSNTMRTPFVSVTNYIEVAQSVSWDLMRGMPAGGIFHLVELQIPQIDLIHMSDGFGGFTTWYKQNHLRTSKANGEVFDIPMTAPGFEILATQITPDEIVNIYPYDSLPPGFEIRAP